MGIILAFIISTSLVFIYFLLHHGSKPTKPNLANHNSTQTFHSVSISTCNKACPNVKKLKGRLFLANEASPLPVAGCTTKQCTCSYGHHDDRRNGDDRRYPINIMSNLYEDEEHRIRHNDRRQDSFEMTLEEY
jgi:hypothetical protein